jgi:hypothetical protein
LLHQSPYRSSSQMGCTVPTMGSGSTLLGWAGLGLYLPLFSFLFLISGSNKKNGWTARRRRRSAAEQTGEVRGTMHAKFFHAPHLAGPIASMAPSPSFSRSVARSAARQIRSDRPAGRHRNIFCVRASAIKTSTYARTMSSDLRSL